MIAEHNKTTVSSPPTNGDSTPQESTSTNNPTVSSIHHHSNQPTASDNPPPAAMMLDVPPKHHHHHPDQTRMPTNLPSYSSTNSTINDTDHNNHNNTAKNSSASIRSKMLSSLLAAAPFSSSSSSFEYFPGGSLLESFDMLWATIPPSEKCLLNGPSWMTLFTNKLLPVLKRILIQKGAGKTAAAKQISRQLVETVTDFLIDKNIHYNHNNHKRLQQHLLEQLQQKQQEGNDDYDDDDRDEDYDDEEEDESNSLDKLAQKHRSQLHETVRRCFIKYPTTMDAKEEKALKQDIHRAAGGSSRKHLLRKLQTSSTDEATSEEQPKPMHVVLENLLVLCIARERPEETHKAAINGQAKPVGAQDQQEQQRQETHKQEETTKKIEPTLQDQASEKQLGITTPSKNKRQSRVVKRVVNSRPSLKSARKKRNTRAERAPPKHDLEICIGEIEEHHEVKEMGDDIKENVMKPSPPNKVKDYREDAHCIRSRAKRIEIEDSEETDSEKDETQNEVIEAEEAPENVVEMGETSENRIGMEETVVQQNPDKGVTVMLEDQHEGVQEEAVECSGVQQKDELSTNEVGGDRVQVVEQHFAKKQPPFETELNEHAEESIKQQHAREEVEAVPTSEFDDCAMTIQETERGQQLNSTFETPAGATKLSGNKAAPPFGKQKMIQIVDEVKLPSTTAIAPAFSDQSIDDANSGRKRPPASKTLVSPNNKKPRISKDVLESIAMLKQSIFAKDGPAIKESAKSLLGKLQHISSSVPDANSSRKSNERKRPPPANLQSPDSKRPRSTVDLLEPATKLEQTFSAKDVSVFRSTAISMVERIQSAWFHSNKEVCDAVGPPTKHVVFLLTSIERAMETNPQALDRLIAAIVPFLKVYCTHCTKCFSRQLQPSDNELCWKCRGSWWTWLGGGWLWSEVDSSASNDSRDIQFSSRSWDDDKNNAPDPPGEGYSCDSNGPKHSGGYPPDPPGRRSRINVDCSLNAQDDTGDVGERLDGPTSERNLRRGGIRAIRQDAVGTHIDSISSDHSDNQSGDTDRSDLDDQDETRQGDNCRVSHSVPDHERSEKAGGVLDAEAIYQNPRQDVAASTGTHLSHSSMLCQPSHDGNRIPTDSNVVHSKGGAQGEDSDDSTVSNLTEPQFADDHVNPAAALLQLKNSFVPTNPTAIVRTVVPFAPAPILHTVPIPGCIPPSTPIPLAGRGISNAVVLAGGHAAAPVPPAPAATHAVRRSMIVPTNLDVLRGRSMGPKGSPGNLYYRTLIDQHFEEYKGVATTKRRKVEMSTTIMNHIKQRGGRFLRKNELENWEELNDCEIRTKIHADLRNRRLLGKGVPIGGIMAGEGGLLPTDRDVLLRCVESNSWPGNQYYRQLISRHTDEYQGKTTGRNRKTEIARMIAHTVIKRGGRFLVKENNQWVKDPRIELRILQHLRDPAKCKIFGEENPEAEGERLANEYSTAIRICDAYCNKLPPPPLVCTLRPFVIQPGTPCEILYVLADAWGDRYKKVCRKQKERIVTSIFRTMLDCNGSCEGDEKQVIKRVAQALRDSQRPARYKRACAIANFAIRQGLAKHDDAHLIPSPTATAGASAAVTTKIAPPRDENAVAGGATRNPTTLAVAAAAVAPTASVARAVPPLASPPALMQPVFTQAPFQVMSPQVIYQPTRVMHQPSTL